MLVAALLAAAFLALGALAPAANAQATSPEYLFVAQPLTNPPTGAGIVTYIVDPTTGSLTPSNATPVVPRTPITGGLALNPAGTFLFAVSQFAPDQSDISVFSVGANGQLTETTGSPYALSQAKEVPVAAAVSPQGKYLYVASAFLPAQQQGQPAPIAETLVEEMAIADDGSLTVSNTYAVNAPTVCPANAVPGPTSPVAVYLHPTRQWFYVLVNTESIPTAFYCDETAFVQEFTILSDDTLYQGALTQGTPASVGLAITGTPDGSLVFVSDGTSATGLVNEFLINQDDGSLSLWGNYPNQSASPLGNGPGAAVDSTSTYFYTPSGTFTFQDGMLAAPQLGANVFNNSTELASPTWPFIFAASTTDGLISEQVNPDGSLMAAPGSPIAIPFPAQTNPTGMLLTGATPLPNVPVEWIIPPGGPALIETVVGQTTGVEDIRVMNEGYAPLALPVVYTGAPPFSLSNGCPTSLPPGATCYIYVNFSPVSVGTFRGDLSVGTQDYPFSATSTAANPVLQVSPTTLIFPDEKPGTTSAPLTITFSVPASAYTPIVPAGITITGTNAQNFSQTNNCTATIQPGQSCMATVTFSASAVANYTAQLNFSSPTANFETLQIPLTGNGATNPAQYTLSAVPNGNGTVTQSPTGTSFTANTIITLTAVNASNGVFQFWSGGCPGSTSMVCMFPIVENTVVGANFTGLFPATATASGPGTVSVFSGASGSQQLVEFTATPNIGASVSGWSGACAMAYTSTNCTILPVTGPLAVTVTFVQGPTYTFTPTIVGPGTISVQPAQSIFAPNTMVQLQAVPAVDAVFTGWTAGPCAKNPNTLCTFAINANTAVTATFAQKYTLATSVVGSGSITQSPVGTWFNTGTSVSLTAVPGTGAGFASWTSGPCSGSTNPVCTFTVGTANLAATATFNGEFTLSTTAVGPGTIMQSPTGASFAPGTMVTLTAVPNTGATFTSWAGVCVGSTNPVCTFAVNANTTATATFAASTNLTLTTTVVGPGTITQSPTGTSFASGTSIMLTAVPGTNATFTSWTGGACNNSPLPNCTFTISANTTVTATFAAPPTIYTLATSVVGPGTIAQSPTGNSFANGTSITLTAMPSTGATFTAWSGGACAGSTNITCTFAIAANTSVTATFVASPKYTLTTAVVGPGTITQTPTGTSFASGTSITLIAVPTSGDSFTAWSGGACNGSTSTTCTFAIAANTSVTATFSAATPNYTLTTAVIGPGTITQSPSGASFASGTAITLTAVPTSGDTFTSWSGGACAGSTNATCAFTLTANTSVTATFATGGPEVTPSQPSQTGGAGSAFTFTVNTSGFSATPTLTATCAIPAGSCSISGTTLTVTTTARTSSVTREASALAPLSGTGGGIAGGSVAVSRALGGFSSGSDAASIASGGFTSGSDATSVASGGFTSGSDATSGASGGFISRSDAASGAVVGLSSGSDATSGASGGFISRSDAASGAGGGFSSGATSVARGGFAGGGGDLSHASAAITTPMLTSLRIALLALFAMLAMWTLSATSRAKKLLQLATLTAGLAFLAACGGGSGGGGGTTGTPAGTYTVTIKATAGTQTATSTVMVVVQ